MKTAWMILAVIGFAAVAWRLGSAIMRVLHGWVRAYLERETGRVHSRRGDLTAMEDARRRASELRAQRWAAVARGAFWLALLAVPPLTAWTREIYAGYSLAWLFVRRP